MSDIHHLLYDIDYVDEALCEAELILQTWRVPYSGHEDMKAELLQGWSGVDIRERIAHAILTQQGFDVECLNEAAHQSWGPGMLPGGLADFAAEERRRVGWQPPTYTARQQLQALYDSVAGESPDEAAEHCTCTIECDCQRPEGEGVRGISSHCPDHNDTPEPDPDCPADTHWFEKPCEPDGASIARSLGQDEHNACQYWLEHDGEKHLVQAPDLFTLTENLNKLCAELGLPLRAQVDNQGGFCVYSRKLAWSAQRLA